MYVLAALSATVTLYAAVRWLDEAGERGRAGWLAGYGLAALASLYTIYLATLAPLVANGYALVALRRLPSEERRRAATRWLGAQVAVVGLTLPWLALALPRMQSWSVAEPFSFRLFLRLYATLLTLGISTGIERYTLYLVPFALTLLGGLATLVWRRPGREPGLAGGQAALLLVLAQGTLPVAVYLLTRPRGLFPVGSFGYTPRVEARYLLLFAPAFCVFLAWSAVRAGRRAWPVGVGAATLCLGLAVAALPGYYRDRYLRDELATMVRILGAYARPGDAVLLISGDRYPLFLYEYERAVPPARRASVVQLPAGEHRFTPESVERQLSAATAGRRRFWVAAVEVRIQDPQGLALPWLDARFRRAYTYDRGYNSLILYGDEPGPLLAAPSDLCAQRRLSAQSGPLELLGYDLPGREYRALDPVDLGLYGAAPVAGRVQVEWRRDDGALLQTVVQEWPATGEQATRAQVRFRVWPWYRGGGSHFQVRWLEAGGEPVRLAGPRIVEAADRPRPERIAQPLDITFANGIRLRGYDLHRPLLQVRPGERLVLDLFWETSAPLVEDCTVFTHLVGSAHNARTGGPLWGQHDGPPVGGQYPTRTWPAGELIADRHELAVDPDAPAGDYQLVVGLYRPATGERVPLEGGGADHALLAGVRVSH